MLSAKMMTISYSSLQANILQKCSDRTTYQDTNLFAKTDSKQTKRLIIIIINNSNSHVISGVKQGILHSFSNLVKELEIKTIHSS